MLIKTRYSLVFLVYLMQGSELMLPVTLNPEHLTIHDDQDYRLIVISDIHGHLDRFKALLKKVQYKHDDYLVILGDFVEKGDQVIDTIHYVQKLDQNPRTFVLLGNCEWALSAMLSLPELANQIPIYLKRISSNGAIRDIYHRLDLDKHPDTLLGNQKQIYTYLKDEITYINQLPASLKFNQFLFVHAGIEKRLDYQNSSLSSLLEMQNFYHKGHILDEIVIVGHIPTSNYKQTIDNSIILDLDKKIICIDGGTGVKCLSQLNALIIESTNNHITYQQEYIQPLPIYQTTQDIISSPQETHKISYPYFEVSILQKENQFSLCYQKETNQTLWIKNEFLYMKNNKTYCLDDYTDQMLSIRKDEHVKLIGIYDEYAYVIYHNQVGWIKYQYLK